MKKKIFKIQLIVSGENISIGGNVALLKCVDCGFETFTLDLQSDTDMVYQGIVSLTDLKKKRLLITGVTTKEFNNYESEIPENLEERINEIFNVNSFKFFVLKSFSINKEKIYGCTCPLCENYLGKTSIESFETFVENGGILIGMDVYDMR